MTRKLYSSASVLLMLLALGLTIALSVWCVSLIVSANRLRADSRMNEDRLAALEAVHDAIGDLDEMLVSSTGISVPDAAAWRDRHEQAIADLTWLRGVEHDGPLGPRLDRLDDILAQLDGIAGTLLGQTADPRGIDIDADVLLAAREVADDVYREATDLVHRSTAQIVSRLDAKWDAIDILAILAVATAMILLFLIGREHKSAERHLHAVEGLRESDDRFRTMLEAIPDVVLVLDANGRYRNVYGADEGLLVDLPEALIGKTIHEVLPEPSARSIQGVIDRAIASGTLQQFDYPLELAGEKHWFSARVVPFATGRDRSVLWVARELTARKRAEEALRDSEARFRQLAENLDQVIWLSTWPDRRVVYVNGAYEAIWGQSRQRLYDSPQSWQEVIHPEDRQRVRDAFEDTVLAGTYDQEFRIVADDNTVRWVRDRAFPIRDRQGKVYRVAGISENITERKLADERFRESEERFRTAFEKTAVGMAMVSPEGFFMRTNEAFREILGYDEDELTRMTYRDVTHPDEVDHSFRQTQRLLAGDIETLTLEKRYIHKSGSVLWGLTSVSVVRDVDGRPLYAVAETQDISERKRAESALQESEERLRQLTENIREVFWMTSADGHEIIYVSPAYEEIWGRSCQSLYDHPTQWIEAIHESDRDRVRAAYAVAAQGLFDVEYKIVRPDGTIRWIRDRAFPVLDDEGNVRRLAGIAEDITELAEHREHLEALVEERTAELRDSHARLRVADRLAMIGTLSAGLVHDMNNVLFTLRCRLDSVTSSDVRPELRDVLDATRSGVDYLQRLCDGLRWLAVDPDDSQAGEEVTELGAWWRHVEPLMRQMVPEPVSIETDFQESLPSIAVAPHRLTQAVLNLVINAAEATREPLPVRLWARRDDESDGVLVGVSDRGCGMTAEVRRRAFDPFFSTKGRSLSTGLGLSVVHGVVSRSGGTARIDSEPGHGTTVTLRFRAAVQELEPRRGQASISLDDPLRAEWISHMIRLAGYDVERTSNGTPADGSSLWVTEPAVGRAAVAREFRNGAGGKVILLGAGGPEWAGAVVVDDPGSLEAIRSAVRQVTPAEQGD